MKSFDSFAFCKMPNFDESKVRAAFAKAVPLSTVVIYCYDPRCDELPKVVAKHFREVHPGLVVTDPAGKKIASTSTMFEVRVAGGRAIDALRSITVAQHLFGVKNIVVVHHTFCGATSFTANGIIEAFEKEQGRDIAKLYSRSSLCISDFKESLSQDVKLVRESAGTPSSVNIYGFLYDIDTTELTLVAEDAAIA